MRQVQVNLANDKLTNEKGEKFLYKGLYNSVDGLYFVYNSERPNHLLALTDKDVENVNFKISADQFLLGQSYDYVYRFGVLTAHLKKARLCKRQYESRALKLAINDDNLSFADVVRGFVELDKETYFYETALNNLKELKFLFSELRVSFKDFAKVHHLLPTRSEYLDVLFDGTHEMLRLNGNNLFLHLSLEGSYRDVTEAMAKVDEVVGTGIMVRHNQIVNIYDRYVVSYKLSTFLSDKYTMEQAEYLNKELKLIVNLLSDVIVK